MTELASTETGSVTGGVRTLLRLEGLTLFIGMTLPTPALGYGLKYSAGFGFTHLGRIGPAAKTT